MRRKWTDGEVDIVRDLYADTPTSKIAERLGRTRSAVYQCARKLGLEKSDAYLRSPECGRFAGDVGKEHRFKPGHKSWNKGKKGWQAGGRAHETKFKPGNKPKTWRPIGSERVSKEGILERKVTDTGKSKQDWRSVHSLIYEEHHGPIPGGNVVIFRNGNQRDFSPENLEAVTRAELMRRNTIHRYPTELVSTMMIAGNLRRKIKQREENGK